MRSFRQIESSRETRLWITQILFPILIVLGVVFKDPEARCTAKNKINDIIENIKSKFKKD